MADSNRIYSLDDCEITAIAIEGRLEADAPSWKNALAHKMD